MYCRNCGSIINSEDLFCRNCGTKIERIVPDQNVAFQSATINNTELTNNYSYQNAVNQDDYLLASYIGKNADKLTNNSFSIETFLFGTIYMLYRKLWIYGIAYLIGSLIISFFLSSYASLLIFAVNIYFSINFKKMYVNNAKEQIANIKKDNPNANLEELTMIAKKKGGTAIWPVIAIIALYFVFLFIIIVPSILNLLDNDESENTQNDNYSTDTYESTNVENLEFTIPNGYKNTYSGTYYTSYTLSANGYYCTIAVSTISVSPYNSSAKEYLKKSIYTSQNDTVSDINTKNINGLTWYNINVEKSYGNEYYYSAEKNNKIYKIELASLNDKNGTCESGFNTIIPSLKIK